MPSLHWILVLTLAFLYYSAAFHTKLQRVRELQNIIDFLTNKNCTDNESKYYSASVVKEECLETALNCTITELGKFPNECSDTDKEKDTIRKKCKKAIVLIKAIKSPNNNNATSTDCGQCEYYQEKTYKEFLSDLKTLIQQLTSIG